MKDKILDLWNNYHEIVFSIGWKIIVSLIIAAIGLLITKGLKKLINKTSTGKLKVDDTITSVLRYVVSYGIFIICLIMILNVFGVNTASLLAILGAAGIAVGLALKDTLTNIAAGIILFFVGSYRIGEFIEFDTYNGTVKEINLFTTILETPDGIYISVQNSFILGTPLKNISRNGRRRMEIPVRIAYSDSIENAFNVLNELISLETRFLQDPPVQIVVHSMQDSYISIVVRAWAKIPDYWDVYWKHMRIFREKFEEAGLFIPFPRQNVHIIQERQLSIPSA
ncbi:MAG: mechanosensitive ion channel [Treponema sp.]|jgi:small conductance mechanosensitive channel|nr:mechanosensitive ion channel [Treponema sp.]